MMAAPWFDALEGRWQLRRRIVSLSAQAPYGEVDEDASVSPSVSGRMTGVATFTRRDATSLAYEEMGELVLRDGTRLKAVRRYTYRLEVDGACVIEFADGPDSGRRFLRFSPGFSDHADTLADNHLCGRDLYQVAYRFLRSGTISDGMPAKKRPVMLQRTVVSGPRKDYAIVSRLTR